jgi:acyl-coenzyme A synthetase/AMP-(fatty) acid ligase
VRGLAEGVHRGRAPVFLTVPRVTGARDARAVQRDILPPHVGVGPDFCRFGGRPARTDKRDEVPHSLVNLPETFNAATYFVDRNVLEGRGERVAIECGDERVTYSQLLERVNRAGSGLRALGVRPEERVQLVLLDSPEFLYSFFGAIKIGAVAVPTSTLLKPADYEYILNDTRARVAIVSEPLLPLLREIPSGRLRYLKVILVAGGDQGGDMPLRQLMEAASPDLPAESTSRDDAAFWLYSSATASRASSSHTV